MYTHSLWETDMSEELRADFVLKSWLGCCQSKFQKSGSWLVVAFLNPSCITTFQLQLSPRMALFTQCFIVQISKQRNMIDLGQAIKTFLWYIYRKSRLYSCSRCMWCYSIQNTAAECVWRSGQTQWLTFLVQPCGRLYYCYVTNIYCLSYWGPCYRRTIHSCPIYNRLAHMTRFGQCNTSRNVTRRFKHQQVV